MITITHTHEAGTLIEGTSKGDGTNVILKALRWRWGRSIGTWYVPFSRDRLPNDRIIQQTVKALEEAGYEVAPPEIDRTTRTTEDVEQAKAERQDARAAALHAKAARKSEDAEQAWKHAHAAADELPYGGEPIKVGHHSERRHRNAIARAHNRMGRAVAADNEAADAAAAAAAAARTTDARYKPTTVANRIEKLAADIRRIERDIVAKRYDSETGYRPATEAEIARSAERYAPKLAELRDQHAYWTRVRTEQITNGTATGYSAENVKKGDLILLTWGWRKVARANAKSVSVETEYSWTDRYPWAEVRDHQPAE